MIRDAEIRRLAGQAGVEPRIMELDYALGWALHGLAGHPYLADRLVFKGGTCLRKCYFPEYRFSEDLDFTATRWFGWEEFEEAVREAFIQARVGHPFSDADELGEVRLRCYALDEIIAEKVRAVLGQRIHAISRDIYDIHSLMDDVDDRKLLAGLPRKMAAREVDAEAVDLRRMTEREDEFRADWARNWAGQSAAFRSCRISGPAVPNRQLDRQ